MAPLIEEFFSICEKRKINESLVIMQVGSFYEAYEDDQEVGCARKLSQELNIHLTKKNGKLPVSRDNPYMCGFPTYTLQKHLTKLNDAGFEVVVYDQEETNPKKRFLRGVYTPTIRMEFEDEEATVPTRKMHVVLVQEYTSKNDKRVKEIRYLVNILFLEMNTGRLVCFEADHEDWRRPIDEYLLHHQPEEVLLCGNIVDKIKPVLDSSTRIVQDTMTWTFQSIIFHQSFGIPKEDDVVVHLSMDRHPLLLECIGRLLRYLEQHDSLHTLSLQKPEFLEDEKRLRWNHDAVRELNLFSICEKRRTVVGKEKQKSLYDILNPTMNVMGKRMLEKLLKQPIQRVDELERRYSMIDTLMKIQPFDALSSLIDLEWYLLRWSRHKLSTRLIGVLFQNYKTISEVWIPHYPMFFRNCSSLSILLNKIEEEWDIEKMIRQETPFLRQRSETLERDYKELESLQKEMAGFEIENTKLIQESDRYVLQLTPRIWKQKNWKHPRSSLPWMVLHETKSYVRITCSELNVLSEKIFELQTTIDGQLRKQFDQTSKTFLETFHPLLVEWNQDISLLSCFLPLTGFFRDHGYTRPTCVSSEKRSFLRATEMRHPIMEIIHRDSLFVPLDAEIGGEKDGYLIYGMNSSGKSTMLKSIGLCQWMAQCGFYVPAKSWEYSPFDAIYTKIGIQDNLFLGHSTFVAEMNELLYILRRSTMRTLVMCDELTSGTETTSATGLVVSTLLHFLEKKLCFFFTTHLHTVSKLPEIHSHPRIHICHFRVERERDITNNLLIRDIRLRYDRHLHPGSGQEEYGIEIAEAVGLPKEFLQMAKTYRKRIHIEISNKQGITKSSRYNRKLLMTECVLCSSTKNLHTHHITPQKEFQDKQLPHDKNGLYNLVSLCEKCHENLHHPTTKETSMCRPPLR